MNTYKLNSPDANDKRTFYHYTNMQALLGIFRSGNITMWATHYIYLNDREEIKREIELIIPY